MNIVVKFHFSAFLASKIPFVMRLQVILTPPIHDSREYLVEGSRDLFV